MQALRASLSGSAMTFVGVLAIGAGGGRGRLTIQDRFYSFREDALAIRPAARRQ